MVMKAVLMLVILGVALCVNYPMYKQCDSKWGSEILGTGSKTICQAGCLMSSAAMALKGHGKNYDPHSLNQWLKSNGGYASGNLFVWASINKLGFSFIGFVSNSQIKANIDKGHVVICNVHNGGHWVLAHSYSGDNINVNDPGYSTTSYPLSGIVNGNTGVYSVSRMPEFIYNIAYSM